MLRANKMIKELEHLSY